MAAIKSISVIRAVSDKHSYFLRKTTLRGSAFISSVHIPLPCKCQKADVASLFHCFHVAIHFLHGSKVQFGKLYYGSKIDRTIYIITEAEKTMKV